MAIVTFSDGDFAQEVRNATERTLSQTHERHVSLSQIMHAHEGPSAEAPAVPSASAPDVRLAIVEQGYHKLVPYPDGTGQEMVVSSLRSFGLTVALLGPQNEVQEQADPKQLEAVLLFEDGQEVPMLPGQRAIHGEHAMLSHGKATFNIKITALSSQRNGQRFRVRVAVCGEPLQVVVSEPVRTITKLHRGRAEGAGDAKINAKRQADEALLDESAIKHARIEVCGADEDSALKEVQKQQQRAIDELRERYDMELQKQANEQRKLRLEMDMLRRMWAPLAPAPLCDSTQCAGAKIAEACKRSVMQPPVIHSASAA